MKYLPGGTGLREGSPLSDSPDIARPSSRASLAGTGGPTTTTTAPRCLGLLGTQTAESSGPNHFPSSEVLGAIKVLGRGSGEGTETPGTLVAGDRNVTDFQDVGMSKALGGT